MSFRFINATLVAAIMLFASAMEPAVAQQEAWKKIAPVGESFTIIMPTQAVEVSRVIPLNDKDSIPERVYYSLTGGRRYMVVSFVKTSPDRVLGLSSFADFMHSIEQSFKGGEHEISLTFERDLSLEGGAGKQYHIKMEEYAGVARFLGTEKVFYALIVIGVDENDAEVQRFLSSFALGETNTSAQSSGVIVNSPTNSEAVERVRAALPPEPWPKTAGPIIGGVLNGVAISLPVPEYPKAARKAHAAGIVSVQILIDEQGYVISAEALDGPSSLRDAAVQAAWKARFTPTRLMGQPVKVNGRILYNFVR